jgi:[acyl-carrier-protein] S-malonyltransferase
VQLETAIDNTTFSQGICPVYQNVTACPSTDVDVIKENLKIQLTAPVKWTQSVQAMIADGATEFIESGPGKVLQGLVRKINREAQTSSIL